MVRLRLRVPLLGARAVIDVDDDDAADEAREEGLDAELEGGHLVALESGGELLVRGRVRGRGRELGLGLWLWLGLGVVQVVWSSLRPRRSMKIPMPSSSEAAALMGTKVRVRVW